MNTCPRCKKEDIPEDDFLAGMCEECFDKMMDKEDEDFRAYDLQDAKCIVCGKQMRHWKTIIIDGTTFALCTTHKEKSDPLVRVKQISVMKDRKCTFVFSIEDQGNYKDQEATGYTRSEAMMKKGAKGDYLVVVCEDEKTGKMHEVFTNQITFI